MTEDVKIDITSLQLDQLGYVYKDVKMQAKIIEQAFKLPEFKFLEPTTHDYLYRGEQHVSTTMLGFTRIFNMQIELIQWLEGECVFKEFITQGKEGLQHVSVFVDDVEAYAQALKNQGFEVAMTGAIGRLRAIYYFDTMDVLGVMLEIQGPLKKPKKKKI